MLLCGLEAVLQADGTVEHQMVSGGVLGVGAEVAQTHELIGGGSLGVSERGLHLTAGENLQGMGVHAGQEVLACGVGIGIVEEIGILTDLGVGAGFGVHPMDGSALDLPAVGGIAALGVGIVGSQDLGDIAVFVGDAAGALDDVGALQTAPSAA